ncbi:hypothetical protein MVES_002648 [Malassezia vespertilionis]|uniref:Uncharacterized protein n=2 Tax=Malassezia vespertilionis TaxID=2020962 RepID=A0A2N1JAB8_9BASI|nr:hypothetical protein MVES_002648 [Malassezia vespertilionis]
MSATLSPIVFLTTRTVRRPRRIALGKGTALASEAIANVRRFALLLLWAYTGSQHVMERLAYHAADEEHPGQVDRIMTLGDVVANVGEAFDVLAFLSGSGLFWSVLGGWTLRRRHGLERVGVFVSLASLVIHLYGLHRRRIEITEEMLESTRVVQNQLDTYDRMALRKEPASAQDVSMAEATVQDEYEQYITNKRRMRWLGMEQIRVVSDASFTLYEACAPDADTNMLEASAGLVTGVLGLLRQWHEARYGSLDI